jgi:hypothetical protein
VSMRGEELIRKVWIVLLHCSPIFFVSRQKPLLVLGLGFYRVKTLKTKFSEHFVKYATSLI